MTMQGGGEEHATDETAVTSPANQAPEVPEEVAAEDAPEEVAHAQPESSEE